jgi:membrane protein implicated in regulation of membrane protease activity
MDAQWLLWLALALVAGVVEIFTLSLVFAMVGGGALAAAVVAGLTGNAVLSVLAFAVSTGVLLSVVRPPLRRIARGTGPAAITGTAALVGHQATVTREVSRIDGEVKLAGEAWTARTRSPGVLETGSLVIVEGIDGATALVRAALHDPAALPGGEDPTDRPES